jgi:hypothetical protein
MKKKLLITVKTYPLPSENYQEIVCTAGIDEDGNWHRLYPINFRGLPYDQQFQKWDWIEVDIEKNPKDFRPESYHLRDMDSKIEIIGKISAKEWDIRRKKALHGLYTDFQALLRDAHDSDKLTSLAVYKPTCLKASYKKESHDWTDKDLELIQQMSLFDAHELKPLRRMPFMFRYEFQDEMGKLHRMRINDWEIYSLYWNCYNKYRDEKVACLKVLEKLNDISKESDLHLFLGTTPGYHARHVPNPFLIIGLFYPPKCDQQMIDLF